LRVATQTYLTVKTLNSTSVFVCDLLNKAVISSDYTPWSDKVTRE